MLCRVFADAVSCTRPAEILSEQLCDRHRLWGLAETQHQGKRVGNGTRHNESVS